MKRVLASMMFVVAMVSFSATAWSADPKSKFYDFSDQLIDGEIRRPTALYTDARQKAKFDRLLRLKKSFLPAMFRTSKEKVFK